MEWAAIHGKPVSEENRANMLDKIRKRTMLFHILMFIPAALFWATIVASLERTPLTGRCAEPLLIYGTRVLTAL